MTPDGQEKKRAGSLSFASSGLLGLTFRTLGPLEVVAATQARSLGGPKQRALALLLLLRDRPVSADRLIEEVQRGRRTTDAAPSWAQTAAELLPSWCRGRGSNSHGVAPSGV